VLVSSQRRKEWAFQKKLKPRYPDRVRRLRESNFRPPFECITDPQAPLTKLIFYDTRPSGLFSVDVTPQVMSELPGGGAASPPLPGPPAPGPHRLPRP
jgi:hypothetical protein